MGNHVTKRVTFESVVSPHGRPLIVVTGYINGRPIATHGHCAIDGRERALMVFRKRFPTFKKIKSTAVVQVLL